MSRWTENAGHKPSFNFFTPSLKSARELSPVKAQKTDRCVQMFVHVHLTCLYRSNELRLTIRLRIQWAFSNYNNLNLTFFRVRSRHHRSALQKEEVVKSEKMVNQVHFFSGIKFFETGNI